MAFLIDREDTLNEGVLDSLKNLGKNTLGKIKDKIADILSDKIKYYTENSLEKVIGNDLDDEVQGQVEDDITGIFTSALDSMFNLGESEEEFDAEGDRYEELKTKLLGGQTMKYEEMEELLAAAKSRNDQKVIDVLKNVVDYPATDAVTESEKEPTKSELLDKLIKMCKTGSGLRIALEEIKDKFALDESKEGENNNEDRDVIDKLLDKIGTLVKKLKPGKLRDKLEDAINMLSVDESNTQASIASVAADRLREGGFTVVALSDDEIQMCSGPKQPPDEDQISSMLANDGIAAQEILNGVFKLDWVDPASGIVDDIEEKEELLPDCVVNEALETLHRMY